LRYGEREQVTWEVSRPSRRGGYGFKGNDDRFTRVILDDGRIPRSNKDSLLISLQERPADADIAEVCDSG
jgi:hypothetical protein